MGRVVNAALMRRRRAAFLETVRLEIYILPSSGLNTSRYLNFAAPTAA